MIPIDIRLLLGDKGDKGSSDFLGVFVRRLTLSPSSSREGGISRGGSLSDIFDGGISFGAISLVCFGETFKVEGVCRGG